jgi:hypothetical protein
MFGQENAEEIKAALAVPLMKPEIGRYPISTAFFAENVPDPPMRFRKMNLLNKTVQSYKLPTPADDNNPASVVANTPPHLGQPESKSYYMAVNLWHSSPLGKDFICRIPCIVDLIILGAWSIWKHRNDCIFMAESPSVSLILSNFRDEHNLWCLAGAKISKP